uniref:Odorant receptor n=1 Tax=Culicoides sonorensis TaxID=179676 RepID=A0A336KNW4_CULSO
MSELKIFKPKPKIIFVRNMKDEENDINLMNYLRERMTVFGSWPVENPKNYLRWFVIFFTVVFCTIPTIIGAKVVLAVSVIEFMQAMCEVCAISFWTLRMIYLSSIWDEMIKILQNLQEMWNKARQIQINEWQDVLKNGENLVHKMSILVYWWYFVIGISYEIVALWISLKRYFSGNGDEMFYGIHANFIIDTQHNLIAYLSLYFPLTITQCIYCVVYASIELLIIFLTNYHALYFKMIQIKMNHLNKNLRNLTNTQAKNKLIEIIKDHEIAIESVNRFENAIKIVLLTTFVMNSFIICFFIFAFLKLLQDSIINFIIFVGFALALHLNLLTLSYFGQKLMDESIAIGNSAWNIAWYDQDIEFQQLVKLIIMRSQKPIGLTAAGFYHISLESYSNVLKTAYSYFTLMHSVIFE